MNSNKYEPIIEQYQTAKDIDEKLECIFTMLRMVACNHLHDVDDSLIDIKKRLKKFSWFCVGVIVAVLFSDQLSIVELIKLLIKSLA